MTLRNDPITVRADTATTVISTFHGHRFLSVVIHEIVTQAAAEEASLPSIPYCGPAGRSTKHTHQPQHSVGVSPIEVSLLF